MQGLGFSPHPSTGFRGFGLGPPDEVLLYKDVEGLCVHIMPLGTTLLNPKP